MKLHKEIADRFVHVAQSKYDKERQMQSKVRCIDQRQYHKKHEHDLQHRPVNRIARGAVSIVLCPVAHAEKRRNTVDKQHSRTDIKRRPGKSHCAEKHAVKPYKTQAGQADHGTAKINQPDCPPISRLMMTGTDLRTDQDRRSI